MKVRIEWTYKTPRGFETTFISDELTMEMGVKVAEDIERTGRSKRIEFVDEQDRTWILKELKEFIQGVQTEPHNVVVYFDGGYDLESKTSGLGCAIYYEQNKKSYRLRKNARVEELESNNEAEYAAFHFAVQELEDLGVHHLPVKFIGDSQVVINQLNGEWPCYEEGLERWIDRIETHLKRVGITPNYELVSRKSNKEADQLATQALKEVEISSTMEMKLES